MREAQAAPSLEQKLEEKLGAFGQDSGVNPAQNKPKQPSRQDQAAKDTAKPKGHR